MGNLSGHSGQRERTKKEERGRGDSLPTPRSEKEESSPVTFRLSHPLGGRADRSAMSGVSWG